LEARALVEPVGVDAKLRMEVPLAADKVVD